MENFNMEDESGNRLRVLNGGKLILKLANEKRVRHIGSLAKLATGELVYIKMEKEKDTFKKTDAWSIYDIILQRVDFIKYVSEAATYEISKKEALEHGSYLHFKKSGYELKMYIPKKYWHIKIYQ